MYVRNVPEPLLRVVRAAAALRGQSMRAFVLEAVQEKLQREGIEIPEGMEIPVSDGNGSRRLD
jgi:plasmid stability protein